MIRFRSFNLSLREVLEILAVVSVVLTTVYLFLTGPPGGYPKTLSRTEAIAKARDILENDFKRVQLKLIGAKLHRPEENEITFSKGSKKPPDLVWTVNFELWKMSLNQVVTVHLDARTGEKIGLIEILA